jgi:F-type H+-transporting ATPase subunit a
MEELDLFHHSRDATSFELIGHRHIELPAIPMPWGEFQLTKFMVLEVVVAVLLLAVFIPLARRAQRETIPKGRFWNLFEAMLVFLRDEVARPAIGRADGDRFVPYLWTVFMFILFCNLMGLIPFAGSATAHLSVTGPLALCTFAIVLASGMQKLGVAGYWKAQVPHMDLPGPMGIVLKPLIFVLEIVGMMIRHSVLAVRLFANIFGGHTVLAAVLLICVVGLAQAGSSLTYAVAPITVLGVAALSVLELFIAFLQAYIFTFLSALFIGMALHPH